MKRRAPPAGDEENPPKRVKLAQAADVAPSATPKPPKKPAQKILKLTAPRPFPAVAASASATGPRSAHKEGNNYICLTRKSSLGAYLRRCKDLVTVDGHKILHLHAMGAAIPLLMELSCALPHILPYCGNDIHTSISTGTVEVQDEVHPDDEGEDITLQTRAKSTLYVIIRIDDGLFEEESQAKQIRKKEPQKSKSRLEKNRENTKVLVFEEPEQEHEAI
ncbi:hypothetical protein AGABI2DRAFT_115583 [Agaricus bisporus var. bisporus H97]|uniref:hypothetical protein n=1 Tax=Agaricus bisporus var. bisporus (strain H97 / ATCC MYA-4626 / FGSC 10389) TaxID=936046 RepID=UPI00029F7FAF|nr:hypothetical protein AGABI2DRAFT_115583 [Agaricus bisporus var. bisporus H97]EKV50508.1 hypothetical protein AGABI2DRAFT_115583 [Agaricus bisporus var. bisporus H97]